MGLAEVMAGRAGRMTLFDRVGGRAIRILLLTLVVVGTACSRGQEQESADLTTTITAKAGEGYYDQGIRYLNGVVTGHPAHIYYTAELEINERMYPLAGVWTMYDLACGEKSGHHEQALLEALRALAPIGTPVVAVRASYEDHLFVHTNPPDLGPSINEQLVRAGFGRINQSEGEDSDVFEESDTYFGDVKEAQLAAETAQAGTWGVCTVAEAEQQAAYAAAFMNMEKEMAEAAAQIEKSGGYPDVTWGDGYCDTCRIARRIWKLFD